jgi:translation initiation factor IF-2
MRLEVKGLSKNLRVYELGRHYGVDSKQVMALLEKMQVVVKSHMSVVEEVDVDRVHAIFQRKREMVRERYAKDHGLNPNQLKNVAALRPLDRPQPEEEPEAPKKKKATKKKVSKKKKAPAKPKVVVITKAGTMTKVAKEAKAKRDAEDAAAAAELAKKREEKDTQEAELARKRDEHAGPRVVKGGGAKLVKKADIPVEEAGVEEAAELEAPVEEETVDTVDADTVETVETPVEEAVAELLESEDKTEAPAGEPTEVAEEPSSPESPEITETVEASDSESKPEPEVEEGSAVTEETPVEEEAADTVESTEEAETEDEETDRLDGVGTKKNDGFKVGDIIRPAPKKRPKPKTKPKTEVSSQSVRDSIEAALRKRKDEATGPETPSRRKRTRKKKQKVDQQEVERQLKQTMAEMSGGSSKKKRKKGSGAAEEEVEVVNTEVLKLTEFITVQELAEKLDVKAQELIGKLFMLGIMTTINQRLEKENIELLAEEFGREVEFLADFGDEVLEVDEAPEGELTSRPPVVTVMGHVDHGKTSLLDSIRKTNVIAGEAGGITQHIGAYKVETAGGPVTFLDTPGHAAFTAMRARGAQVTDIVILIVAADDRVMPQTIEAINHAKAAEVPLIVAINKIDLPAAKPDVVKQELLQHDIMVEEYGGDVQCAEISAKQGIGIDHLMELIHLQSEVLELTASAEGPARGVVVEAKKEQGRGVLFTILVDRGILHVGDNFLVGMQDGKVRAIMDERGRKITEVKPGEPCEILGGNDVPESGDRFYVMGSEREAREMASKRRNLQRQQQLMGPKQTIDLDNLADMMADGTLQDLPIIIKGDVAGSVEALADQLMDLNTEEVQVKVVHKAVGAVSESDVLLAANTGAMIIGFHMRPGSAIRELAKKHHVTIEVFDIIYEAVDTMRKAMAGLLGSIKRERSTGRAQVRQVFTIPKTGQVAGSMVVEGIIKRKSMARLIRDEVVVYEGKVNSLRRFKDAVKEVATGYECGIGLENFYDIQEGDYLETFEIEEIERTEL